MMNTIDIFIPYDLQLTEKIRSFKDQEKYLMLKIGYECVTNSQLTYTKLNESEFSEKLKEAIQTEIRKLEMELNSERQMFQKMEEKVHNLYERDREKTRMEHEAQKNEYMRMLDESKSMISKLELELKLETERGKIREQEKMNAYDVKVSMLTEKIKLYEENIEDIIKGKLTSELNSTQLTIHEKVHQINMLKENYASQESIYKAQIQHLNDTISTLNDKQQVDQRLSNVEMDNVLLKEREKYTATIESEKSRYMLLLDEKQKTVEKITEKYEEILSMTNKSASHKGSEGEKKFETFAETFKDFKGYELKDKHTQSGEGDFHLNFDEFSVLVDAKNYKKKVPVEQREKIKNDLVKNEHISFGWLVSLNTSVDKFDRAPVMYEWINTKQCLVYVNNLLSYDDPAKILRIVWFTCKELYKLVDDVNVDEEELVKMREQRFVIFDKVKALRKSVREINTNMNATRNMLQVMDDQLKDILGSETNDIVESCFSLFDDWWTANVVTVSDAVVTNSTDLWYSFKHVNKDVLKQFDITPDKFKQYLKTKVPVQNITFKGKSANNAMDIKGVQLSPSPLHEDVVPLDNVELVPQQGENQDKAGKRRGRKPKQI
jgi:hypothetical protein